MKAVKQIKLLLRIVKNQAPFQFILDPHFWAFFRQGGVHDLGGGVHDLFLHFSKLHHKTYGILIEIFRASKKEEK